MNQSIDYATFTLGGLHFGIRATDVLELNKNLDITPVPKSPKTVRGIMNLRGQLVPAIDMYARLTLFGSSDQTESISIILQSEEYLIALLVDDVGEIVSLDESTFEPPGSNVSAIAKSLVLGVHKLSNRLIIILDPVALVNIDDMVKSQTLLS
jgi:purine-binding chemotaxis protein CheW